MDKKKGNYRQSVQRERILQLLRSTQSHPTADWIYSRLKPEIPSLSQGTVYRNLGILQKMGKVKKLHYGSTFDRYEVNTGHHYHLICDNCDSISDIEIPACEDLLKKASEQTDFRIISHEIEFHGLCRSCSADSPQT